MQNACLKFTEASNQKLNTSPLGSGMFTVFPTVPVAFLFQDLVNTCQFLECEVANTLRIDPMSIGQRMDSLRQVSATLSNRALRAASAPP